MEGLELNPVEIPVENQDMGKNQDEAAGIRHNRLYSVNCVRIAWRWF